MDWPNRAQRQFRLEWLLLRKSKMTMAFDATRQSEPFQGSTLD